MDPVASGRDPSVSELAKWFRCVAGTRTGEDCVVLARYGLSACAVPLPVSPGSTSLVQPLDAVLSIACSFAFPWMSLELHVVSTRKCVWTRGATKKKLGQSERTSEVAATDWMKRS